MRWLCLLVATASAQPFVDGGWRGFAAHEELIAEVEVLAAGPRLWRARVKTAFVGPEVDTTIYLHVEGAAEARPQPKPHLLVFASGVRREYRRLVDLPPDPRAAAYALRAAVQRGSSVGAFVNEGSPLDYDLLLRELRAFSKLSREARRVEVALRVLARPYAVDPLDELFRPEGLRQFRAEGRPADLRTRLAGVRTEEGVVKAILEAVAGLRPYEPRRPGCVQVGNSPLSAWRGAVLMVIARHLYLGDLEGDLNSRELALVRGGLPGWRPAEDSVGPQDAYGRAWRGEPVHSTTALFARAWWRAGPIEASRIFRLLLGMEVHQTYSALGLVRLGHRDAIFDLLDRSWYPHESLIREVTRASGGPTSLEDLDAIRAWWIGHPTRVPVDPYPTVRE